MENYGTSKFDQLSQEDILEAMHWGQQNEPGIYKEIMTSFGGGRGVPSGEPATTRPAPFGMPAPASEARPALPKPAEPPKEPGFFTKAFGLAKDGGGRLLDFGKNAVNWDKKDWDREKFAIEQYQNMMMGLPYDQTALADLTNREYKLEEQNLNRELSENKLLQDDANNAQRLLWEAESKKQSSLASLNSAMANRTSRYNQLYASGNYTREEAAIQAASEFDEQINDLQGQYQAQSNREKQAREYLTALMGNQKIRGSTFIGVSGMGEKGDAGKSMQTSKSSNTLEADDYKDFDIQAKLDLKKSVGNAKDFSPVDFEIWADSYNLNPNQKKTAQEQWKGEIAKNSGKTIREIEEETKRLALIAAKRSAGFSERKENNELSDINLIKSIIWNNPNLENNGADIAQLDPTYNDILNKAGIDPTTKGIWEIITGQNKKLAQREFDAAIKRLRNRYPNTEEKQVDRRLSKLKK